MSIEQAAREALEGMKSDIAIIVALRDKGLSVEEIFQQRLKDAMTSALDMAIKRIINPDPATDAPAVAVTPGFFPMIGTERPLALQDDDHVYVRYVAGNDWIAPADQVMWQSVKEWMLVTPETFLPHIHGDGLPPTVNGKSVVDIEFDNARAVRGAVADNVDWKYVARYRVVKA